MSDVLFTLLIIFIVFGVFRRYIFFFIMSAVSKRLFKEMNRMQERKAGMGYTSQQSVNPETKTNRKKSIRDDQGEYVDYVEVKD